MTVAEPETVAVQRIESQVAELPALAEALVVDSPESYARAGELVKICGERVALVKRELDPVREKAHAAWKGLVSKIAELCAPAEQARKVAGRKMGDYDREQDRLRREAEAAAEAERRRLAVEEEIRLAAAVAAEAAERTDDAEAELSAAVAAASAPVPVARYVPPPPKVAGVAMRTYWSAEVVDLSALVEWVGGLINGAPRMAGAYDGDALELVGANMPRLNEIARRAQCAVLGIPGVRGVERREPARTGR